MIQYEKKTTLNVTPIAVPKYVKSNKTRTEKNGEAFDAHGRRLITNFDGNSLPAYQDAIQQWEARDANNVGILYIVPEAYTSHGNPIPEMSALCLDRDVAEKLRGSPNPDLNDFWDLLKLIEMNPVYLRLEDDAGIRQRMGNALRHPSNKQLFDLAIAAIIEMELRREQVTPKGGFTKLIDEYIRHRLFTYEKPVYWLFSFVDPFDGGEHGKFKGAVFVRADPDLCEHEIEGALRNLDLHPASNARGMRLQMKIDIDLEAIYQEYANRILTRAQADKLMEKIHAAAGVALEALKHKEA